jgi:hypothetical protein
MSMWMMERCRAMGPGGVGLGESTATVAMRDSILAFQLPV